MSEYTLISWVDKKEAIYRVIKPQWSNAGIFSYVWGILQSIYTYPNNKYYIDMTRWSPYYDPETVKHTENVWEYYFQQPDSPPYPPMEEIIETGAWLDAPSGFAEFYNVIIPDDKKIAYHNLIKKHIHLLPHIQKKIDDFVSIHGMTTKKILGVHCRGSSKNTTQFGADSPITPALYIKEIELVEQDYEKIFVISDSMEGIDAIKTRFGDKVIPAYESYRPEGAQFDGKNYSVTLSKKYQSGEDAIVESYLLSYASYMIVASSNTSTFSRYLNLDLHLNKQYLNLYAKYRLHQIRG